MGFREVADVFDGVQGLAPAKKLVLVALADRANEEGISWPSVDELCRRTCQSKSTTLRHLQALQDAGLLDVQARRKQLPSGRWVQATNVYRIRLAEIRAGKFMESTSGCQNDTLKNPPEENSRSDSGCQNETLNVSGCQNQPFQGVTGDTPTKDQLNNHPSPQPPMGAEETGEGTAAPSRPESGDSVGEGNFPQWTTRLRSIALALIGQSDYPDDVTTDELAQVRQLLANVDLPLIEERQDPHESEASTSPAGVITQVEPTDEAMCQLAREVLPAPMQAMGVPHLVKVGKAIKERIDAGWRAEQLSQVLSSRELPVEVRSLVALVMARLRDDVPVALAPVGQPPQAGSHSLSTVSWSHTLPSGRVVTRRDLDNGQIAVDFTAARSAGEWAGEDRLEYALAVGIERYLVS